MLFIKWHCFAGPVLAAASKKCSRLLLAVTAGAVALGPVSTALATNYYDLVAQGYRWATVDGPYASPAKDDLRQILKGYSETRSWNWSNNCEFTTLSQEQLFRSCRPMRHRECHKSGSTELRAIFGR